MSNLNHKKCIFVLGPTASGKSDWALAQAEKHNGSIVNIDSIQFYKELIIGSAAPSEADKKRVPHHLYSYVPAPHEMTAGRYIEDFYHLLAEENPKFPLFIVGGTGFYIQALEKGLYNVEPVPPEVREALETELQQHGAERLWNELTEKDPGHRIHVNDHYRLIRALEIIRYTQKKPSELKEQAQQNKKALQLPYLKIGFDFEKSILQKRVEARTEKMLQAGLVDEVKNLVLAGYADWSALQSVGYKETLQFLKEAQSEEWLKNAIQQSTMKLIKKQKTWFKRDSSILWSNHESALNEFLS